VDTDACLKKLPGPDADYCKADVTKNATSCLEGVQRQLDKDTKALGAALAKPCAASFVADNRPQPAVKFAFPVEDRSVIEDSMGPLAGPFHMDHSVSPKEGLFCLDFNGDGPPHCYGGHTGTDFMLKGGFSAMAKQNWVIAAAPGTVVRVVDGNYDHCHSPAFDLARDQLNFARWILMGQHIQIDCDGNPLNKPNYIEVDHGGGIITRYFHLKKRSPVVKEGDRVTCGQRLAQIGSSGKSSAPHLHFEVQYNGRAIDPFQGKLTPRYSFWRSQGTGRLPASGCK
jgi:murein DD-endopeptidase MepM/ murein hydrolase activator NlpD